MPITPPGRALSSANRPTARRAPAGWLRRRLLVRLLVLLVPALVGVGVLAGAMLERWQAGTYGVAAFGALVVVAYVWLLAHPSWSLSNLVKGMDAEYRIGQVIDYALVPADCAVAHGVTGLAAHGDIDHLAATPARLWVIETKVRAVPPHRFPEVLDRLAANVDAVRRWAPGVPVRGCLVLLEPFQGRRDYEAVDGTPVVVHDEKSLRDALRTDARGSGPVKPALARRVWALGQAVDWPDRPRVPRQFAQDSSVPGSQYTCNGFPAR